MGFNNLLISKNRNEIYYVPYKDLKSFTEGMTKIAEIHGNLTNKKLKELFPEEFI